MFVEKFDRYVCDGEQISCEVDGFTVRAIICDDRDSGPPWQEEDGHGPVSDWTSRNKRPGERTLVQDHGSRRFYDFAEAVKIARRDRWGPVLEGKSAGEIAAAAVERDFKALKAWCNDEWHYVGVRLAVFRAGVPMASHAASLWGIEANYPDGDGNAYLTEVANELLDEALDVARKQLAKLCAAGEHVGSNLAASLASYVSADDVVTPETRKAWLGVVASRILADIGESAS
jgi:hypothetical protein